MFKIIQNIKGSTTLILVLAVAVLASIIMSFQSSLMVQKSKGFYTDFNEFSLATITKSSFEIMESALERRLWEPPPDSNCLRSNNTKLNITGPNGENIEVTAKFDAKSKLLRLIATGSRLGKTVRFNKIIKIFDASDFLLYSDGNKPISMLRNSSRTDISSLIAGPRKLYIENPILVGGEVNPNTFANLVSNPAGIPEHALYSTVLQGDRISLLGGLEYRLEYNAKANNVTAPASAVSLLNPVTSMASPQAPRLGEGVTVITDDFSVANTINSSVQSGGAVSMPGTASYYDKIYPFSLFCGSPPLTAATASDSGCYNNNISDGRYVNLVRNNQGVWISVDLYCFSDPSGKRCTRSKDFPQGFKAWRKDAGLENILLTENSAQKIDLTKLNWDNMEALKEDAQACGKYIPAHTSAYTDCDISDQNFLDKYVATNGSVACEQYSKLNMNTLSSSFNSFNPAVYADNTKRDSWLRRVVFSEVPLEIAQNSGGGLWSSLSDNTARKNLPLWVVSPDVLRLKPNQQDTTSPISVDPGRRRDVFFNKSATPGGLHPLKMVLLSPEALDVVSPFHDPVTKAEFSQMYPLVAGRIRPHRFIQTDYVNQEDDGFRYGSRNLNMSNIILITNSDHNVDISLHGLWSGYPQRSVQEILRNYCLMDKEGGGASFAINNLVPLVRPNIPSYASDTNPVVPPPSSRFYDHGANKMGIAAEAFHRQYATKGIHSSQIDFQGLRILTEFDDSVPAGLHDLSQPQRKRNKRTYLTEPQVDLSERSYTWQDFNLYQTTTDNPCTLGDVYYNDGSLAPPLRVHINEGDHTFTQRSVGLDFSDAGNFGFTELTTTRSK